MWKKSYRKNLLFRSRHNFRDRDCIMGPRRPGYGKLIESGGYINSGMAQEKGDPSSSNKFSTNSNRFVSVPDSYQVNCTKVNHDICVTIDFVRQPIPHLKI